MPVDTRDERASVISTAHPFLPMLPLADASVNQADRQQVSFAYVGILAGAPIVITILPFIQVDIPVYMTQDTLPPFVTQDTPPPFHTDGDVPI